LHQLSRYLSVERCIQSLRQTIIRPFVTHLLLQHYQAGFQSGKSTTDQLFALRQILEKGNEYNIQTHHLFKDFKAAYDTIIRNEVYVSMSELSIPKKLIRLTAATLNTEYFETRQGLRQRDVLSTLIFNVVLDTEENPDCK
jgi:Reverse transcriptase (RNA-dependent DNA polymerase)